LINDFVTTLRKYVLISINVEEIEAVIKAWLIDVEVYDLLLRVFWLRRMHCNQKYDQSKIIVMRDDMTVREISVQLMSVSTNLSVMKLNEDDDWTTDEVCQHLLEKRKKHSSEFSIREGSKSKSSNWNHHSRYCINDFRSIELSLNAYY